MKLALKKLRCHLMLGKRTFAIDYVEYNISTLATSHVCQNCHRRRRRISASSMDEGRIQLNEIMLGHLIFRHER